MLLLFVLGVGVFVMGIIFFGLADRVRALEHRVADSSKRLLSSEGEVARLRKLVNAWQDSPAPPTTTRSAEQPVPATSPVEEAPPTGPEPSALPEQTRDATAPAMPSQPVPFKPPPKARVHSCSGLGAACLGRSGQVVAVWWQHRRPCRCRRPLLWRRVLPELRRGPGLVSHRAAVERSRARRSRVAGRWMEPARLAEGVCPDAARRRCGHRVSHGVCSRERLRPHRRRGRAGCDGRAGGAWRSPGGDPGRTGPGGAGHARRISRPRVGIP